MSSQPPLGIGQDQPIAPVPGVTPSLSLVPSEPAPVALTPEQEASKGQLLDVLGMSPGGAVIPFPQGEEKELADAKTVEAALPLIGNMLKAERAAGGKRKPYPRSVLKHQHIVAFMVMNPLSTTAEICSFFGISATTLSNITKSDTFKALVQAHQVKLESGIGADLQEQLRDTLAAAVEVVQKAVTEGQDPEYALEVLDKAANRLGMGAKHNTGPMVQVNVVTPEMIAAARASRRLS